MQYDFRVDERNYKKGCLGYQRAFAKGNWQTPKVRYDRVIAIHKKKKKMKNCQTMELLEFWSMNQKPMQEP